MDLPEKIRKLHGELVRAEKVYISVKDRYHEAKEEFNKAVKEFEALDMEQALADGRTKKYPPGYSLQTKKWDAESLKRIAERLDVAFTTAQRAIHLLQEEQIIFQTDDAQRDRVFCANAAMDILDEAPKINP